jgi:hypothetical protein
MGMVIPKVRKHLCVNALLRLIQDVFSHIPDRRKGDAELLDLPTNTLNLPD